VHKITLTKPDGRALHLYSRKPISGQLEAPSPSAEPLKANPHLRWHPLLGQWVSYASHRQNRTFLPPAEYNPLAPMRSKEVPTELPAGSYDVAAFDNLFPALASTAQDPSSTDHSLVSTQAGRGACEVVVFSQDPHATLGGLPLDHIELLIQVWGDRYRELGARDDIHYVMPFENRGVEVGVTLHHPHGQIYSYPFVPPIPAKELELQKAHFEKTGGNLMEDFVKEELRDGRRVLFESPHVAAFVPACARYPYETWISPRLAVESLADLKGPVLRDFARALKTILLKFDALWNRPFPYLMVFRQAPTDGARHPEACMHAQIYPALRTRDRLKYLAGTELGAGMFANDSLPEEKAAELQKVSVRID
jgi:UDPglucose--hexose-1-phosphate uridylyltransferase